MKNHSRPLVLTLFLVPLLLFSCFEPIENIDTKNSVKNECKAISSLEKVCRGFYPTGELKYVAHFVKDKQHGKTISYFKNDIIEKEVYFNNGVLVDTSKTFFQNGALREVGLFKNGLRTGIFKYFNKSKVKIGEIEYDKGSLQGVSRFFNQFGNVQYNIEFKNSLPSNWNEHAIFKNSKILLPPEWRAIKNDNPQLYFGARLENSNSTYIPNLTVTQVNNFQTKNKTNTIQNSIAELTSKYPSFNLLLEIEDGFLYEIVSNTNKIIILTKIIKANDTELFANLSCLSEEYDFHENVFNIILNSSY